jgi:hypothetical protein
VGRKEGDSLTPFEALFVCTSLDVEGAGAGAELIKAGVWLLRSATFARFLSD